MSCKIRTKKDKLTKPSRNNKDRKPRFGIVSFPAEDLVFVLLLVLLITADDVLLLVP